MKTEMIMKREFLDGYVTQNHKTGQFNINTFMLGINKIRVENDLTPKIVSEYLRLDTTIEFLESLAEEEDVTPESLITVTMGRNGGRWVHPLILVDVAMWANPKLKVKILKWVGDSLLLHRDNSGDSFKEYNEALTDAFPDRMSSPYMYPKIANMIASKCGVAGRGPDRWNDATEAQLKLRDIIHNNIVVLADSCKNISTVIKKATKKAKKKMKD